jgi:hypothetical protein
MGKKTSGFSTIVVPVNPRGATPTIVSGLPLTTSSRPTTAGLPAKPDCQ